MEERQKLSKVTGLNKWPLTFAERQMAIEQGLEPESVAYNINVALAVTGKLEKERLQNALNEILQYHPILKSYYPLEHGEYVHRCMEDMKLEIKEYTCDKEQIEKQMQELNLPFSLEQAPLLRANLFKHNEDDYTLSFCVHHILFDGGSMDRFMADLLALYEGKAIQKPEFDYFDYAVWSESNSQDLQKGEEVFRTMFEGGAPENEMPTVAIRPEVLPVTDTEVFGAVSVVALKAKSKKLGVTGFELLTAALGITLAKYCGSEDVVVGAAMGGRVIEEQRGMIGMFVNSLPIRVKPVADKTNADYIKEVSQTIRTIKENQTYPFEKIVSMVAPDRNSSRSPVFDVMFNYLQANIMPEVEGLEISMLPLKKQSTAMDFVLEAIREGDQLRLSLEYSKKLYEPEIAENFMEHFLTVVDRILTGDGSESLVDVAELPDRQKVQILEAFKGKQSDEYCGKTFVGLFKERAQSKPDNQAVVFKDNRITYGGLDELSDRLAAYLIQQGIQPGDVVAYMIHRSILMPICELGIMKARASCLPLDPGYPADRLEFMLEDAGTKVIIADSDLFGKAPAYQGEYIATDMIEKLPPCEVELEPSDPEDLMMLLYTSGTTGKPKGVMLLQKNLANFIHYYCNLHQITEKDHISTYASFGFDAHMLDTYPTLVKGACLYIIPEEMRLDLEGLAAYFDENDITVSMLTTQLGRQFAENMKVEKLRSLSIGGETLVPVEPPRFDFYNLYGPTECTIICTAFKVDKMHDRVPIGGAIENTAIYVVDSRGRLAPVGTAGELCIAGRQVAKGYLNRPDLTEEKFVENPFSQEEGYERMYLSGDVVRFVPSGDIDFIGRRDHQVKIRGFRVELTEIEGRIREFPIIKDATVIAQDDAAGGKRIVAYIVSDEAVDIKELESFIGAELPSYMIPIGTMQIDRIPLTQNGKVNRRELPDIVIEAEEVVPPETELEQQLVDIVAPILGMEEIGITTDVMYAGLNSLSAIKLSALITETIGKKLSTMEIMREKTIQKMALLLEESSEYEEIVYEKQDNYPLTQNQLGLYFACMKEPDSLVYNVPFELQFGTEVDIEKLQESFIKVVEAHPYLNTYFKMVKNEPRQCPLDDFKVEISVVQSSKEEYESRRKTFVRPFYFFKGALYRAEIHQTEMGVFILCDFHHIIFDGGSADIVLRDLETAYKGIELQKETFTSYDLSLREESLLSGEGYKRAKAFFHERVSDGEGATILPTDKDAIGTGTPITVRTQVEKAVVGDGTKGLGVTPSNLFLAATTLVTGRFASAKDVRIATISNGRDGAELQHNIGMLVKTLPVVLKPADCEDAKDYLLHTQAEMMDIMEHQICSYLELSSTYHYNAQLLYAFQGGVVSEYRFGKEPVKVNTLSLNSAKFPISVNIQEDEKHYYIETEYDDALFKQSTMEAFGACIGEVAQILAKAQNKDIKEISILAKEQKLVIDGFNKELQPIQEEALHHIFESCVEVTPDAPALYAKGVEYTYRELNEKANALAHSLLDLGVEREDRVAFLLPRDGRILVSMLGIMKAGCAYIPVDPDYPEDRIEHVISDSGAKYIITDGRQMLNSVDVNDLMKHEDNTNPDVEINRHNLCYIIYTSGSTGKPKGVMLTHENIMNYVVNEEGNRQVRALKEHQCTMVSVTTVSFDMFLKEAFTTLMNGLKLVLADDDESKNPLQLAELFAKTGGTAFNATPSRMLQYMELPEIRDALAKCKVIMAGGEGYPSVLYQRLRGITDATLINTYGPTETTVSCNGKYLTSDEVTVGAPLHNVLEQVMDVEGNPLPVGMTGELWIGGTGVARGYFGNEEMTKERFVTYQGERYYKSGDLARWTPDGDIAILGRNDGQIKLRGLRIELGEIEKTLGDQDDIKTCVVLVRELHGQEHLCAYYTATSPISPDALRTELLKSLTVYMVPTAYLQLDEMPMTPNGKIDRKALPEPQLMKMADYVKPETEDEETFCAIFADILKLEKVGATDNFFHLGGTSLLVTQVTIDATNKGYTVNYGDVFENPTPRELASLKDAGNAPVSTLNEELIEHYDYSEIERLLQENTLGNFKKSELRKLGNICITGATGFLGIHVLREFLRSESGIAYCVIRGGRLPAEERLKEMLVYYFSEMYEELFGTRIILVDGDITSQNLFDQLDTFPIDTYINCAANVKHFSMGTDIEDVNVKGVQNGVNFCKEKGCMFVQISTSSVAGMSIDNEPDAGMKMDETMLYFGQDLSNKYTNSKFLAERIILEAATQGLKAKIMRVGNLMARDEDGEFQVNFRTNNFLGRLKAYTIVGCIPYGDMGMNTEFAPIDYTAKAVLKLATTPLKTCIFHPYNDHSIYMGDVIKSLVEKGVVITPCEKEEYDLACKEAMRDPNKAKNLNSLIAYQEHGKVVVPIKTTNSYTSQTLYRLGFQWPITSTRYLENFFDTMIGFGFFDTDDLGNI